VNRYLLDTNILSDAVKLIPSPTLTAWLQTQRNDRLFISSITVAEIHRGILDRPRGSKRSALESWFVGREGPLSLFAGRILPFDESAALAWSRLMAEGRSGGRPRDAFDMLIAAIALIHDCVIVTDNTKDFSGVETINPMRPSI
jgi:predicted nucleic acid-binding protein